MSEPASEPITEPVAAPEQEPEPEPQQEPDEAEEAAEEEEAGLEQVERHPPEPEGLGQKQIEQMHDKFEREAERHRKRIAEILGPEAEMLLACPLCEAEIPGFVMPAPNLPERFPAVRVFMGDSQPRVLRPDPDAYQCEVCGGEGVLDSGSHVQGQDELTCLTCGATGWVGPRKEKTAPASPAPAVAPADNGPLGIEGIAVDPPEVAELKRRGYAVLPPPAGYAGPR